MCKSLSRQIGALRDDVRLFAEKGFRLEAYAVEMLDCVLTSFQLQALILEESLPDAPYAIRPLSHAELIRRVYSEVEENRKCADRLEALCFQLVGRANGIQAVPGLVNEMIELEPSHG